MKKWFYTKAYKWLGWSIEGKLPSLKQYIIVVAPHTSNWDFLVGLGARAILEFNPQYVAKKELFIWPLGYLFKSLGGYPVERKKNTNFVQQIKELFEKEENFVLTITPEGTRSFNPKWKTGFFYAAKEANVPIVPVGFDYESKKVILGKPRKASGEASDMILELKGWFSQFKGKNPEHGVREE